MPYYENVFIARQEVSAAQVDSLTDSFAEIIGAGGGTVHRREYWGLKTLAYRIKKNRKGHYVLFNIEAESEAVQEMERQMRLNEDILRHMTVRTEELPEGASVVMQGRGDRERARRDDDNRPPRGERPAKDKGGERPARDKGGERPSRDKGGEKPAGDKIGDKPTEDKGGEKPAKDKEGAKI